MAEIKLKAVIEAEDRTAGAIKNAQTGMQGLQNKVKSMQPAFRSMATAGGIAFTAISAFAYKSVDAYAEAEKAQERMEHILRTATGATDDQILALNRQAEALEKVGVVSADVIRQGQGQLASFDLQADSIEKLIPSVLNYAVAEKGLNMTTDDLQSVTNGLAQALNGNFASLTKTGFVLDDVTKEMLSTGTETERITALTEVLDSTYAGMNEQMRKTTAGGIVGMQMALGKLQDEIGKALTPALTKLLAKAEPVLEKFTKWAEENPELLAKIILIGGAVLGLVTGLGLLGMVLPGIIAFFTTLAGPAGIILAILIALAWTVTNIIKIFIMLRDDGALIWEGIKIIFNEKIEAIKKFFQKWIDFIKKLWTDTWQGIKDFFSNIWDSIINIAKVAIEKIKSFLQPIIDMVEKTINKLKQIGAGIKGGATKVGDFLIDKVGGGINKALGINDGIVQNGQIITTHPDDYIIATKTPETLGGGGGKNINININGAVFSRESALMLGDIIIGELRTQMRY